MGIDRVFRQYLRNQTRGFQMSGQGQGTSYKFPNKPPRQGPRINLTYKSGVGTTANYDKRVMYKRKRAPAKYRKRARKAYRRFVKQSLKLVGSNTVVFNTNTTASTNNITSPQNMIACHLSGTNAPVGGEIGSNDINNIFSNDTRIATSGKVMFKTALMDLTVRNSGTFALECDIYELSYKDNTKQNGLRLMVDQAATDTPTISGLPVSILLLVVYNYLIFLLFLNMVLLLIKKRRSFCLLGILPLIKCAILNLHG
jgi:hypothetical protein